MNHCGHSIRVSGRHETAVTSAIMARAELFVAVSVALLGGAFVGYYSAGLFPRQPLQRSLLSIKVRLP